MNAWRSLCASMVVATSVVVHAEVSVTDAWVRGTVPGQSVTGAFMTIRSTDATRLVAASSPVAAHAEIHRMVVDKDTMVMRPVTGLDVPANGRVDLQPGGYHVMLLGLKKPLGKGEKVPVTLTFQGSNGKETSTEVQAEVRPLGEASTGMKMN